jgi:outer membrane protein assembly factor BamB
VHITVNCPRCQTRYQLDASLRGKQVRCPNPVCREVFEVREAWWPGRKTGAGDQADEDEGNGEERRSRRSPPQEGSTLGYHVAGSVGDLVPILGAEEADNPYPPESPARLPDPSAVEDFDPADIIPMLPAENAPEAGAEVVSWDQPPPVRRPPPSRQETRPPVAQPTPAERETPKRPASRPASEGGRTPSPPLKTVHGFPIIPKAEKPLPTPATIAPALPAALPSEPQNAGASPAAESVPSKTDEESPKGPDLAAAAAAPPANDPLAEMPRELDPGVWEPPPIRSGPDAAEAESTFPATDEASVEPVAGARRRNRWLVVGILGGAAVVIAGLTAAFWGPPPDEVQAAQTAQAEYDQEKYVKAADLFRKLAAGFPSSERHDEYEFLANLSDVLARAREVGVPPDEAFDQLNSFVRNHDDDPLFLPHQAEAGKTFAQTAENLARLTTELAAPPGDLVRARQVFTKTEEAQAQARKWAAKTVNLTAMAGLIDEARQGIARAQKRHDLLVRVAALPATPDNFNRAAAWFRTHQLSEDAEAKKLLGELRDRIFREVRYVRSSVSLPRPQAPTEGPAPVLVVVPELTEPANPQTTGEGVVLALARGVLYALAKSNGHVLWATRVGIDTSALPVSLPPSETAPEEILLVLSSDTNVLTARNLQSGQELWHHDLPAPCLGQPVISGRRAFVPTFAGRIHEIEILSGQQLGWYDLGLPLSIGGTAQEGTNLVYFPADSFGVYVLDVEQHTCQAILQTGHPSGSLRSEPIVIRGESLAGPNRAGKPQSYLILGQTDGLEYMKLRAFALPLPDGLSALPPLQPELRIRGWSWFEPTCDGEKIVLATDRGELGLFGINQMGDLDKPLFRLPLAEGTLPAGDDRPSGRAQVLHVEEDDLWVLVHDKVVHLHLGIDRQRGLDIASQSPPPLPIGSPLHAPQVDAAARLLFLVTKSSTTQNCLASAIGMEDHQLRWQRQLGLACHGDPVRVENGVLAVDEGGGLFFFDGREPPRRLTGEWHLAGRKLADALEGIVSGPFLLPTPDGKSAYEILCRSKKGPAAKTYELVVRTFDPSAKVSERVFSLGGNALAGTPGLLGAALVLPLDDGGLFLQALDQGAGAHGPSWRATRVDEGARGHIVPLLGDVFLSTDGSRGLRRWHWTAGEVAKLEKQIELPDPIVAPPVVVPLGEKGELHVAVADAAGTVHLLRPADWQSVRHWDLKGKITAGPFLRGHQIGCVVEQRRLVWLDPTKDDKAWVYTSPGEGIVGQPNVVGGVIVVADLSGHFVAVDPATGEARNPTGYRLQAQVAPATAPVAFRDGQLFAPLTDGTVVLPSLDQVAKPR